MRDLDDGIAFVWPYLLERPEGAGKTPTLSRFWLPVAPALEFSPLGLARQRLYVRRFLDREGPAVAEGWALESKELDRPELKSAPIVHLGLGPLVNPHASGLYAELLVDHRIDKTFESEHCRLIHFRRD